MSGQNGFILLYEVGLSRAFILYLVQCFISVPPESVRKRQSQSFSVVFRGYRNETLGQKLYE